MAKKPIIEDAVSIVFVRDIDKTLDFYTDILNFEKGFVSDDKMFATISHGEAAIHFVKTENEDALNFTAHHASIYLWVKNLDALYDTLKSNLESLGEGRVKLPFIQDYGMKEFHVKDPDGCTLLFGENVEH
ncbi:MAG: VOC family protein [Rhodospirillales bacterium]|nr:VOC family protein [Rhodospirillales bacterium]